jgi:transposase
MMGHRQVEQTALFYEFSLERHIPADHLLRSIDRFVEVGEVRRELARFYSSIGRPSIDPELMIRMLIIGYCFGIRSERRLCEEVHLNLAYRWFCQLGLDGEVPDHSTFAKNRHGRFRESDFFRRVFEAVLRRCIREGLVGGEGFAVDASLIKADANRQKGIEGKKGLPPLRPQAEQARSIWLSLTMLPLALRPRSRPSSSHRPTQRRAGPAPMVVGPSLRTPRTIWWTSKTRSSSMSRRPRRSARPKYWPLNV